MFSIALDTVEHWAAHYSGPKFHALLCDPPYEYGFMGKSWDAKGVSFRLDTWAALAEQLLPGAFGMAFAGARTWHRVAVAIEDAGLIIHPSIFGWAYGSDFPKATRIKNDLECWQGHRYGLQALKPALEPIIVFQKPYEGRPVECITETGAGALWIEGGRIPANDKAEFPAGVISETESIFGGGNGRYDDRPRTPDNNPGARWPANFVLDEAAAKRLDEMSGELKSGNLNAGHKRGDGVTVAYGGGGIVRGNYGGDSGGAARFFFRYVADALDEADPVRYQAKASRAERDAGLEEMPLKDASERHAYTGLPDLRMDHEQSRNPTHNPHPTIKPIGLTRYLATLLLPPAEYAPRRILVPFAGAGSEMIGAGLAGWDEIQGIEMKDEYHEIAEARLKHWLNAPRQLELISGSQA